METVTNSSSVLEGLWKESINRKGVKLLLPDLFHQCYYLPKARENAGSLEIDHIRTRNVDDSCEDAKSVRKSKANLTLRARYRTPSEM